MKKHIALVISSSIISLAVNASPGMQDGSFYLGGSLGGSMISDKTSEYTIGDNVTMNARVGYKMDEKLALEVGYSNLVNKDTKDKSATLDFNSLNAVALYHIGDASDIKPFIKGGYSAVNSKVRVDGVASDDHTEDALLLGAGLRMNIDESMDFRVEYDHFDMDSDSIDQVSLGIDYSLGKVDPIEVGVD